MKINGLRSTVFLILSTFSATLATEIPEFIKICSRNDPHLDECVKESVHNLRPHLKDGIKELMIPPMEPLDIGNLNILQGDAKSLSVKAKNLKIFGASNFEIKKIRASDNGKRFDFDVNLPHLQGFGDYEISGQLLGLPLSGQGPFTGNFTNFQAHVKIVFDVNIIQDIERITLKTLKVKTRTGQGSINLENLFNGDKALGDSINESINQSFEAFAGELIAPIDRALEKKFLRISSQIIENFTYNELFPVS